MTKTSVETISFASKKAWILLLALALIAVSAVLCLTKGPIFNTEFGGGSAITVQWTAEPTQADVDRAVNAVKQTSSATILSVQKYGTDSLLIRTTPLDDTQKVRSEVASALSLKEDYVKVGTTARSVSKDALISVATSLLIAGGIALLYFAFRFGILSALATLFGFVVMIAVWLIPYTLFAVFDYTAFTVLAVGVALFTLESAAVLGKRIKKASDLNSVRGRKSVLLLTAALVIASLLLAVLANLWTVALPLIFVSAGAAFASLLVSGSFLLTFKK